MLDIPFMVSGSTLLTALSTSKGYRTMNGLAPDDFFEVISV
jgi:hypothetical protein